MGKRLLVSLLLSLLIGVGLARAADVVINEVFYNPAWPGEYDNEWVELYNTSVGSVDLGGWVIGDGSDTTHEGYFSIPTGTTLQGGGYAIICHRSDSLEAHWGSVIPPATLILQYEGAPTAGSFQLANGGDDIHLYNASLGEVDVVWYGNGGGLGSVNAPAGVPAGHSIGRYPNGADSGNCSSDFRDYSEPTPGRPNPAAVGLSPATWGKIKAMFSVAPGQRKS